MIQPSYNAEEIDKNLDMLERCTQQCLLKIAETSNTSFIITLENRLRKTWMFADFAVSAIRDFPRDDYIEGVLGKLEALRSIYNGYLNKKMDKAA